MKKKHTKIRNDHVNPDGLEFIIDWNNFPIGSSIFIPAIDTTHLIKEMHQIAKDKNINLKERIMIDGEKWGVRFWRML